MPPKVKGEELRAAFGLRPHSGWAVLVLVAAPAGRPEVIDRRRIEIADPEVHGSRQPYHAAEGLGPNAAAALLERCAAGSLRLASEALQASLAAARTKGCRVVACGLLLASGRPLPELEKILASHALIHAADGEHFRDALAEAARGLGLPVLRVREREVHERAGSSLRLPVAGLSAHLAALGPALGPPWTQDQKLAALVGWTSLAASRERGGPVSRPAR